MKTQPTAGDWHVSPISGHLLAGTVPIALRPIDRLPEQEANFALLAASKKLLAALKNIKSNSAENPEWIYRVAAEAINAAEGGK